MARRKNTVVAAPVTFVGTFYDVAAGVYIATRKDGSITVGQMNKRGTNVSLGAVVPNADPLVRVER